MKSGRDKSSQEETSVIDSNIGEENRIEEYTGTTNLKVQCNTSQVYDRDFNSVVQNYIFICL